MTLLVGVVPGGAWAQPTPAAPAASVPCTAADCRDDIDVSVFTGISVDSFVAKELQTYINGKDDAGEATEQLIAGFDFQFRMIGDKSDTSRRPSLWLYGETVHGARSGEAKCGTDAEKQTPLCKVASLDAGSVSTPNAALAIFRKAQTLEAFMGLRVDFHRMKHQPLKKNTPSDPDTFSDAASTLYFKAQLGLLTVAGRGGDVVDMHHAAFGVALTRGGLMGSYVEAGYGVNDLFLAHRRRFKVDGFLSINIRDKAVRPFAQIVIDSDFKDGPDTIQSYFGFDIDVRKVWQSDGK
jgi:hypothetical protein